jgi:hypothetical protein
MRSVASYFKQQHNPWLSRIHMTRTIAAKHAQYFKQNRGEKKGAENACRTT